MTYVITTRRGNAKPLVINDFDSDEATARDWCRSLAANGMDKVTLHSLSDSGVIEPMAAWSTGGKRARKLSPTNGTVPAQRVSPQETAEQEVPEPTADEEETAEDEASEIPEDESHSYEGFCVKCREKREFYGEVKEMSNGRLMAKGNCPVCQAGISRILPGKASHPEPEWQEEDAASETEKDQGEATIEGDEAEAAAAPPSVEFSEPQEAEKPAKSSKAAAAKTPPTRRRTTKKVADGDVPDEVKEMQQVATCPQCGRKQPVMDRAGLTIFMTHSAPGLDRCPGSTTVVQNMVDA